MAEYVLAGGLTTSEWDLRRVAQAAQQEKVMDKDPLIFTFPDMMENPRKFIEAVDGAETWIHSAGHLALKHVAATSARPARIISWNAPEPASQRALWMGGVKRAAYHTGRLVVPAHDYKGNAAVAVDTLAQTLFDGPDNFRHIPEIGTFSGTEYLDRLGVSALRVTARRDEFKEFRDPPELEDVPTVAFETCHDGILLDPRGLIASLVTQGHLIRLQDAQE